MIKSIKYVPTNNIKACIIFVHGMCEHQLRYQRFANYLKDHGFLVLTYDQKGHGQSVNDICDLGFISSNNGFKCLVNDLDYFVDELKLEYPSLPIYIFSHSMGTIVTRNYMMQNDHKISKVVLSGAPNYVKIASLGKLLAKIIILLKGSKGHSKLLDMMVIGSFNKSVKNPVTSSDWLSYNKENVKNYLNDPLCGYSFTNSAYYDLFEGINNLGTKKYEHNNPNLEVLFIYGEQDPCVTNINDSIKLINYKKTNKIMYENCRHEILNEDNYQTVYNDILNFFNK